MKPKIEPIKVSDEQLNQLNQILNGKMISRQTKNLALREVYGGFCSSCNQVPSKNVIYKLDGIELIERYCDSCFSKYENRIAKNRFVVK